MAAGREGDALLGRKQAAADRLRPLAGAPALAVPDRHEAGRRRANLGHGQARIFSPCAPRGTPPGTDG